jgi:acetyl-CoA carboxylase biotin carboxyl carrier protein
MARSTLSEVSGPMAKLDDILTFEEVVQILRIIEAAPRGGELNIQLGDASLRLRLAEPRSAGAHHAAAHPPAASSPAATPPSKGVGARVSSPAMPVSTPKSVSEANLPPTEAADVDREKWVVIRSPMVGIFYRAPAPGEPPFIEIGDSVEKGQQVGIIEVMKLMNRISSPCAGIVREICVENSELAGFDAPLMWIEPQA